MTDDLDGTARRRSGPQRGPVMAIVQFELGALERRASGSELKLATFLREKEFG